MLYPLALTAGQRPQKYAPGLKNRQPMRQSPDTVNCSRKIRKEAVKSSNLRTPRDSPALPQPTRTQGHKPCAFYHLADWLQILLY